MFEDWVLLYRQKKASVCSLFYLGENILLFGGDMMSLLLPDLMLSSVFDVTPELLKKYHKKAILLDVDNTLTTYGHPEPAKGVREWLAEMQNNGIPMVIVSNNTNKRVAPFAKSLGLDYEYWSFKPFSKGIRRACKKLGCSTGQVVIVGDQIFTDVLGGNLAGIMTILVEPFVLEQSRLFKIRRRLEKRHIEKYKRLHGG